MGGRSHFEPPRVTRRAVLALSVMSVLAACSALEPVELPSAPSVLNMPAAFSTSASTNAPISQGLLDLFDDPLLTAAVSEALSGNLDLRQSAKRLELAGIDLASITAERVPQLSGDINASRGNLSGETVAPTLNVQWEIDLWGRQADQRRAARADQTAEGFRHQAMRDSVAAQVMQAWFDATEARQQYQLERRRLKVLQRSADNTRANFRAGIGALEDLSAIDRDVALSEARLAENQGRAHDAVRRVEVLLGQYPDNDLAVPGTLPRLRATPAPGVPLSVLGARPDMQAAWQDAVAANSRIAVSQKELLPQISLTGQFGSTSRDFSALSQGATVWSLASALTVPIFEAGRRRAAIEASKTRADRAMISYLQTAVLAFSEVEQALDQESLLARRETQLVAAVAHARATEGVFETRYRAGLATILDLLSARSAVFDIQSQLLSVRKDRLNNRVALGLALGKGV
ncbi:TolC family protein [Phaeobacter sp.]|uniref:TolC family protein n=1 Tax=Phaeobacter sp. TaxID=1902409 RepID=UPI0025F011D9|nr:TolC family protein [Phaeobacter sp.]